MKTVFLRLLEVEDKAAALRKAVREPRLSLGQRRFELDPQGFASVPGSPFSYWVSDRIRRLFKELPSFEAEGRQAQRALSTNSDFRYIRTSWERIADSASCRPASGWLPFAKGGAFSPFYADIHLLVNWVAEGREIEAESIQKFPYLKGNAEWVMHRECNYLRPGLTWPIKNRFSFKPRALPAGCIFAHVGPSAFVEGDDSEELSAMQALMSSSAFTALVRVMAGWNFEIGIIQRAPFPRIDREARAKLGRLARSAWALMRSLDSHNETSHAFALPALLQVTGVDIVARARACFELVRTVESELSVIQAEIDEYGFALYGIDEDDRRTITEGFGDKPDEAESSDRPDGAHDEDESSEEKEASVDAVRLAAELVSWAVGVAFGRFDIRLATGAPSLLTEPKPFDPLPICSPGMLVGDDGRPHVQPPEAYPLTLFDMGTFVDDSGCANDLTAAVRAVFEVVFGDDADRWLYDVAATLETTGHDLRTWLVRSFFDLHLKQYSKSRRKAPIVWQLGTSSGRYSIWLYAHRLTRDTFFQLQNDVMGPKLALEERRLTSLIQNAGINASASERRGIDEQTGVVDELRGMLDEIKRVAPLWNPNLNDGVVLTMAPLWRLVPQHKLWQRELKSKWDELVAGKYDWADIAMHLWPERVVPKCATDRSLAIAHGLEDVFWIEGADGKWNARKTPTRPIEELVRERSSAAVKASLKSLLDAPIAASTGRTHKRNGVSTAVNGRHR